MKLNTTANFRHVHLISGGVSYQGDGIEHEHGGLIGAGQHEHPQDWMISELAKQIAQLRDAAACLATEIDMSDEPARPSAEELVERILYPEHFAGVHRAARRRDEAYRAMVDGADAR